MSDYKPPVSISTDITIPDSPARPMARLVVNLLPRGCVLRAGKQMSIPGISTNPMRNVFRYMSPVKDPEFRDNA